MRGFEKWLAMALLCLSGSIIFWMPFLSDIFYVPMEQAFGFSKTQIGFLSSVFGTASMLSYFPGGWLADRFSPRILISVALAITALGGFVFSTLPTYGVCLILYGIFGVSAALILWSAMIKATRQWGAQEEQGRAFGFLEGGRNMVDMTSTTLLLGFFAFRGAHADALSETILALSWTSLILAILVWRIMKDNKPEFDTDEERPILTVAAFGEALRLPIVWMMAIIIMAAYSGMWGTIFFTPFATEVLELGDVLGGAVGTGKYWIAFIAAIAAGFVADRIGGAKAVLGAFCIMTAGFLIFAFLPGSPSMLPLLLVNVAVITVAVFGLRGIYFSLLEQGRVPVALTGTATGVISVIGYTPDIFLPPLGGYILDGDPGAGGYQALFLLIAGLSFVGLLAAYVTHRKFPAVPVVVTS